MGKLLRFLMPRIRPQHFITENIPLGSPFLWKLINGYTPEKKDVQEYLDKQKKGL